jgi:predicted transglutaminase-like cysteine proteinase
MMLAEPVMSELPFKAIGRWIRPMPSRLVVVAVALFGLTGLQDPIARDPFGAATIAVDSGQLAALWRDERAQLVADHEAVAACLRDHVPDCAAMATLLEIVAEAKAHRGKALIAHINRAINLLIRPAPGAWVGALEVLTFADGDCKDYSIAKFFALHEAGVPPERVRLVIVRNRRRLEDHMVVAVYDEDEGAWVILDNASMVLATDTENAALYIPLFVLDKAGVRRY